MFDDREQSMRRSLFTCFCLVVGAMWALVPGFASAAAPWESERQLSPQTGYGKDIAAAGRLVHFIYEHGGVYYRRSEDEGASWSSPTRLSSSGSLELTDMIAASGQDVWVLYLKDLQNFTDWCCPRKAGNLYMRRSTDGGKNWGQERRLTSGARAYRISMTTSGSDVHITW